jgi:uncharacterized lipoprotein YajG
MNHTKKSIAAWLASAAILAGCQREPMVTVSYVCEQGHHHQEVMPAARRADGSLVAAVPAGNQIECLPNGGEE